MARVTTTVPIIYPESDGKPLAENTLQYEWIEKLKGGLEAQFSEDPEVFVAADLLWYPVEGNNRTRQAPDVFVAIGRPKGYRGSYRQWEEDSIAPQVVFEILSPGNRAGEMVEKAVFYERHGVEEYYLYDPHNNSFDALLRSPTTGELERVDTALGFVSPRLGIRFDTSGSELRVYHPNGELFKSYAALVTERERALQERERALQQRDEERERAERLAARLRELGIDPETV
jgi:Uma2 family endonuclease